MDSEFRHQRRMAVSAHPIQIGLDYIQVEWLEDTEDEWNLLVYFIPAAPGLEGKQVAPETVTSGNIQITKGGVVSNDVELLPATPETPVIIKGNRLQLTVKHPLTSSDSEEQSNSYQLKLINIPNLDPFFEELSFGFRKPEQISTKIDPQQPLLGELKTQESIEITYLAKDYSSFRQLILDRLSVVMPKWRERNPADIGIVLTEILAYTADSASYYQDAVATEAYLSKARQRISIRRHCRLVDYVLHEGCNARVWVYLELQSGMEPVMLHKDSMVVTGASTLQPVLKSDSREAQEVLKKKGAKVFQTLHDLELRSEHNKIEFYAWGASEFYLKKGTTKATLVGHLKHLQKGDLLLLEEVKNPQTGEDGDPEHRQVVRLTMVNSQVEDVIGGRFKDPPDNTAVPLTEIEWALPDALKFSLCVAKPSCPKTTDPLSLARGNIVLADHGKSQEDNNMPNVQASGDYRPQLSKSDLTYSEVYKHEQAKEQPAAELLQQNPQNAVPVLCLQSSASNSGDWETWYPQPDLLNSNQFASDFVVEMESDRTAYLRFGDGNLGKAPLAGSTMKASYRSGNGTAGNVGREAIAYLLPHDSNYYVELVGKIAKIYNPLAAEGGIDPEPIPDARLNAPQAFRIRQNCVTEADYVEVMQRYPEVQKAAAQLRWTGSWYTMFIAVDRYEGKPIDDAFKQELRDYIMPFRLMGHDLEIVEPTFVPLDIVLQVTLKDGYFQNSIRRALEETFGNKDYKSGRRGFFHPDNFTFGQPVFLSRIIKKTMDIDGVYRAEVSRFQVWGRTPQDELNRGVIATDTLSIVRVDNNPYTPEYGLIEFELEGGI
ncbi:MAG: putative baseplate assembly protein [Moorea sp. SIOASIH]|uniref:putative baseplate assembly protein n=1 Tax=Moorena sp. SIOASIH TaxID=2607817 RepID=UPI0013BB87E6|nr:putative baseplate assembly protein [Moorena sp. SIOASIH]NEO40720.1 putative baseplate assembly protein [Moorena sp. SIOASIH]